MRWKDAIPVLEGGTTTTTSTPSSTSYSYINIPKKLRILFYIGFMLNAPLLPSYPCFVQYTNLSLGVVNALLHTNLTLAWGMQAWSIYHICLIVKSHTASTGTSTSTLSSSGEKKYLWRNIKRRFWLLCTLNNGAYIIIITITTTNNNKKITTIELQRRKIRTVKWKNNMRTKKNSFEKIILEEVWNKFVWAV